MHPTVPRFARSRPFALIGLICVLIALILAARPAHAASPVFTGTNGVLVVDAEHAVTLTPRNGTAWRVSRSRGAVGGQALAAMPTGGFSAADTGAVASYPVSVDRSGVYSLWVRARAASSASNSVSVGLDGQTQRLHLSPTGDWTWNNQLTDAQGRTTRQLTRGDHTLTLIISEGGAQIDRVLLTTDASFTPSGDGPAESARGEPMNPVPPPPIPPRPTPPVPPDTTRFSDHPAGCRAGEVFQDSQDWWMHVDPAKDFGHVHTQVCFPLLARFAQPRAMQVTTALHANPGTLYRVDVQVVGSGPTRDIGCNDTYAIQCMPMRRTLKTCVQTGGTLVDHGATCRWTDTLTIDPRRINGSGLQQFRFRAFVREPDGTGARTSTSLHAYVVNDRPARTLYTDHGGYDYLRGRGWYTDAQYASAYLEGASQLLRPIRGVWTPTIHFQPGENFDGTPPMRMSGYFVGLDSDFHHDRPGVIVAQGNGEYHGPVRIDTTKLTNGWHRLFLKGEQRMPDGHTNAGVLATYFFVQN